MRSDIRPAGTVIAAPPLPQALGVAVVTVAMLLPSVFGRLNVYDAGISASAGTFLLHGQVPYRDFWLLYGPGTAVVIAAITLLAGPSIEILRIAGLVSLGTVAAIGFLLVRRHTAPSTAILVSVASVAPVPIILGAELSPWVLSVGWVLLAILVRREDPKTATWAGVCLGVAALFRPDVGGYGLVAALLLPDRRKLLIGFSLVAIPFVLFLVASTPISALYEQLIWYPLVGPRLFRGLTPEPLGASLVEAIPLVLVPRLAIIASALSIAFTRDRRPDVLFLTAFAALCQLQTQGRGDSPHLAQAAIPAALLLATVVVRAVPAISLRTAVAAAASSAILLGSLVYPEVRIPPDQPIRDLRRTVEIIRTSTTEDEPIFVGLTSHQYTVLNPLIIYYLADRRAGVHQAMFNPGITNTERVQREMAASLEGTETRVVVLDSWSAAIVERDNESRTPGSTFLDGYLEVTYRPQCVIGTYTILVRVGTSPIDCSS